jgi:hypothetical protein
MWHRIEESEGERLWALGFSGMESTLGFDLLGLTRDHPMGMDERRLTDRVTAQVGRDFPGPGPR